MSICLSEGGRKWPRTSQSHEQIHISSNCLLKAHFRVTFYPLYSILFYYSFSIYNRWTTKQFDTLEWNFDFDSRPTKRTLLIPFSPWAPFIACMLLRTILVFLADIIFSRIKYFCTSWMPEFYTWVSTFKASFFMRSNHIFRFHRSELMSLSKWKMTICLFLTTQVNH